MLEPGEYQCAPERKISRWAQRAEAFSGRARCVAGIDQQQRQRQLLTGRSAKHERFAGVIEEGAWVMTVKLRSTARPVKGVRRMGHAVSMRALAGGPEPCRVPVSVFST